MNDAIAQTIEEPGEAPRARRVLIPDPVGHQVLVEIHAVGVCHTDITLAANWPQATLPVVLGHEGAGIVRAIGPDVTRVAVGDRVALTFDSCGACAFCAEGHPAYCTEAITRNYLGTGGIVTDSGTAVTGGFFGQSSFATLALGTERNTIPVGDLPFEVTAPLGCSVQTGVGTVTRALNVQPGEDVAVFGAGAVGLAAIMGAAHAGARRIVAVDPVAERRALAQELGATHVVDAGADAVAAVIEATGGVHAAVDTTARADVLNQALQCLRPRGALAAVGLGEPTAELPTVLILTRGLRLMGVIEGDSDPASTLPDLAAAVRDGALPVHKLVRTYDDFGQAWSAARDGSAVKAVWTPNHPAGL